MFALYAVHMSDYYLSFFSLSFTFVDISSSSSLVAYWSPDPRKEGLTDRPSK